jgi:hypothetical protein
MVEAVELARKKSILHKFIRAIRKPSILFKIKFLVKIKAIKSKCSSKQKPTSINTSQRYRNRLQRDIQISE